jgi:NAD(P)-dependent dehydrogenase (short-subunit alcohol dehydrogenase family)
LYLSEGECVVSDRLSGKVAVISGIASGIARECALLFAREGAVVLGSDINAAGAQETVELGRREGLAIEAFAPVDMFDLASVNSFLAEAASRQGHINVLVNAAAIAEMAWIEAMTPEQFRRTIIGEVDTVFYATRAAWPHLKRYGGAIVNIASVAAHISVEALPALAHTSGKGAVLAMTRQLAMEGAPHNIRANSISPGLILTAATKPALEGEPGFKEVIDRKTMLKRLGQPRDIAFGCLYLASDKASFVTETDLMIDGGMTAW